METNTHVITYEVWEMGVDLVRILSPSVPPADRTRRSPVMATTAAAGGILRSKGFGAGLGPPLLPLPLMPPPVTKLRFCSQTGVSWNPRSKRLSSICRGRRDTA